MTGTLAVVRFFFIPSSKCRGGILGHDFLPLIPFHQLFYQPTLYSVDTGILPSKTRTA